MENFVRNSKLNIEEEIKRIELQSVDPLDRIRQIIGVLQVSLTSLKTAVAGYQFRNAEEEILFFKVSKPQISGLLMFYVRLYQIEKNRIGKSLSSQCRYLKIELENLQKHFRIIAFMNIIVPVGQSLITTILFGRIMIFFLIYIAIYWIEIFLLPPCMIRVLQKFWRIIV